MTRSPQFVRLTKLIREKSCSLTDFNSTAFILIQTLCEWFHYEWGTFWHVDSEHELLKPIANWHASSLLADKLMADTERKCLHVDEGNAGLVWRTGKPKCTANLVMDMCLPRSLDAKEAGLVGGIWIAVQRKKKVVAVIEMLGTRSWTSSQVFLDQLERLGMELGEILGEIRD